MIFIPLGKINFNRQMEMYEWLKKTIGDPSKTTWFWAKHDMSIADNFEDYRQAIVFVESKDITAFKLKFDIR